VFRAYHPEQDKLVAVKLFKLDLPPDRVHRLVAELQALVDADLTHPAIAAPIAAGISGVEAYLAQDFVAAESVDAVVRAHGPAPPIEALRVAVQLAGAFDFAADAQIVHGALHPRDALVSPDDVRVTGLGIVRALERVGVPTPVRRPYTAPERAAGASWDGRADIFSLAAIVHELLWGRRVSAFGEEAAEALTDIVGADVSRLRPLFARALAENPEERFASATQFAAALEKALALRKEVPAAALETSARAPIRELTVVPDPDVDPDDALIADEDEEVVSLARPTSIERVVPEEETHTLESTTVLDPLELDAPISMASLTEPRFEGFEPAGQEFGSAFVPDLPLHDDFDVEKVLATDAAEPSAAEPDQLMADFDSAEPVASAPAFDPNDSMVEPTAKPLPPPIPVSPSLAFADTGFERSRSAVWPLSLTLAIGVALGFALGYGVANRPQSPILAVTEPPAPAVAATSGITSHGVAETEVRLLDAPKPAVSMSTDAAIATSPAVRPASAPAAVATTTGSGRILVRSTPAGATAYLDGKEIGRTPVTLRDVTRGSHTIRVAREGFSTAERRVSITAARPSQSFTVALERPRAARSSSAPVAGTGQVSAESRPAGASVFLDGKRVGKTPMVLTNVSEGDHSLAMDLEGFRRWSSPVRVVSGERARITASLER